MSVIGNGDFTCPKSGIFREFFKSRTHLVVGLYTYSFFVNCFKGNSFIYFFQTFDYLVRSLYGISFGDDSIIPHWLATVIVLSHFGHFHFFTNKLCKRAVSSTLPKQTTKIDGNFEFPQNSDMQNMWICQFLFKKQVTSAIYWPN